MTEKYSKFSNAEIKTEILRLKNEYESKKLAASAIINDLKEINNSYLEAKKELIKRGNGWQL